MNDAQFQKMLEGTEGAKIRKEAARAARRNFNITKNLIWRNLLKGKGVGFKFRRCSWIYSRLVTFYCPQLKLIFEVNKMPNKLQDKMLQRLGFHFLYISIGVKPNLRVVQDKLLKKIQEILGFALDKKLKFI